MFQKKKKKSTNSFTVEEIKRSGECWKKYLKLMEFTQEEYFKLWDDGFDMAPRNDLFNHVRSKYDN